MPFGDAIDQDRDGAFIDDLFRVGTTVMGAVAGGTFGEGPLGAGAGALLGHSVGAPVMEEVGDYLSDLMGTRGAPDEHCQDQDYADGTYEQGYGQRLHDATDSTGGTVGRWIGALAGGSLGALGGPVGLAEGATLGASAGSVIGHGVDRLFRGLFD